MGDWQPISTARAEVPLLFYSTNKKIDLGVVHYGKCTCEWMDGFGVATHWHPLPAPPEATDE